MEFSTEGGRLIPEQVWDAADIPERELFTGKPTGSACPLVWAHSEYIKLRRSLRDGKIFDQPPQTVQRYQVEKRKSTYFALALQQQMPHHAAGQEVAAGADRSGAGALELSTIGRLTQDTNTDDTGLGTYVADLPTDRLSVGSEIVFTFYWLQEQRWEGTDFSVVVER